MALPPGYVELRSRRGFAWVREDLVDLGLDALWAEPAPLAGAKGRGGVGTLELRPGLVAVARTLRRGGALGPLLGERYPGPARVRTELEVLTALRAEGVPVVTPLAAVARRPRAFWRLRLLTELESASLPLPAFCAEDPVARRWAIEAAAVTVRLAFAAGLRHPDLHPDNVLCSRRGDKVRAVLVDLDKASLAKPLPEQRRDAMLVRMARYQHRNRKKLPGVFSLADQLRFLRGLGLDRQARAEAWPRLQKRLERELGRRRLLWRARSRG